MGDKMANKAKEKETIIIHCDHCEAKVAATVEGEYDKHFDEIDFAMRYTLLRCPECHIAMLGAQDDEESRYSPLGLEDDDRWSRATRLFPASDQRKLGTAIPEPIRQTFAEALDCFEKSKSYTASAIMCRKVLEGVCDSHGAKKGNLATRLKDLYDKGELDKRLFDWITALRIAGNEAAHDVNVTVSREDAGDLLDLTEAVAEYLYTFKEKFDEFQKRRKSKGSTTQKH
ncbi:MAG: DUF4145 domain-containing protein [Alphaproteobacteria bacterium]